MTATATSTGTLRALLHGLPGVDKVGVEAVLAEIKSRKGKA